MTNPTVPATAEQDPLSDEYINAVIQRHGYQSPESVIAQLAQWIGLHGGQDSVTLLMYEAHMALSKLHAPVADERAAFEAWALTEFTHPFMVPDPLIEDPDGSGDYINRDVKMAWAGYQQARAALASAPVAGEAQGVVYPPDGTESSFTVINLGSGAVQMGPCLHDGRIGGLWFGKDGQGMGHEQVLDRHAHPGETIAVVTFANVEGLDVMLGELLRCREQYFPDAKAAPQTSEAVPVGIINAARHAGFSFLRRADGSYTLQPIVMATAQADKDGGDCAKGAGDEIDLSTIAGMLYSYACALRQFATADELQYWHYIPEIEDQAKTVRAALASAPVAGEAQPVAWAAVLSGGKRAGRIYATCDTREEIEAYIQDVHQSSDSLTLYARPLSFPDAAPQASDAVRNAALEEAAQALEKRSAESRNEYDHCKEPYFEGSADAYDVGAFVVRALKTQADKDGGDCAKGAGGVDEPNAEAWLIEWQPGDGNTWVEVDANEVRAREKAKRMGGTATPMVRAALSAQPAKEPANSKPSAAGNAGAAGVSSDPLFGKNNDEGSVYG